MSKTSKTKSKGAATALVSHQDSLITSLTKEIVNRTAHRKRDACREGVHHTVLMLVKHKDHFMPLLVAAGKASDSKPATAPPVKKAASPPPVKKAASSPQKPTPAPAKKAAVAAVKKVTPVPAKKAAPAVKSAPVKSAAAAPAPPAINLEDIPPPPP